MNVLELFAGSCSFSKVAQAHGYSTFTTDIEQFGDIDLVNDVREVFVEDVPFFPDVIWASPPCTGFSVASIGTHWGGGHRAYEPKTETARLGIELVEKTIELIEAYKQVKPDLLWYVENPRGVLRKLGLLDRLGGGAPHRNLLPVRRGAHEAD